MALDILYIVQPRGQRIIDINDNNLPVRLALVQKRHNSQDFDLLDLTRRGDELTNLTYIERIIIPLGFGFSVLEIRIFPRLVIFLALYLALSPLLIPGEMLRSSKGSPYEESSYERIEACPSLYLA